MAAIASDTAQNAGRPPTLPANDDLQAHESSPDDTCDIVLRAWLHKHDPACGPNDWRNYALFIREQEGGKDRCFALDEKPIAIFHKHKDAGQSPVFIIQHIKDLKSPVERALRKHEFWREKRAQDGRVIDGNGTQGTLASFVGAKKLAQLQPSPPDIQPGSGSDATNEGGSPANILALSDDQSRALVVYPYLADKQDELTIAFGNWMRILAKDSGYWLVHLSEDTKQNLDGSVIVSAGWVPKSCLLELAGGTDSAVPLIDDLEILSASTAGVVLGHFEASGVGELGVREGDKVRVYKRYDHWSYVVRPDDGQRGWTPSWLIGKAASTESQE